MNEARQPPSTPGYRGRLHEIIFEADTPVGKTFDLVLIASILLSIAVVMLSSVKAVSVSYGSLLHGLEWFFTVLFSIEYLLRLYSVRRPLRYALSFYGLVDLVAIAPTYISLFLPGSQAFLVVRVLRLLRIFRVLKLVQYLHESQLLFEAVKNSSRKIVVFLFTVTTLATLCGSLMYLIEGPPSGFTSIPRSIYWAIVTLTTVGYGDVSPQTPFGQFVAGLVMILGYSIIAVPTGIVTAALIKPVGPVSTQACPDCSAEGHDADARCCKYCGAAL
jgi:voltage-gated potassium channel